MWHQDGEIHKVACHFQEANPDRAVRVSARMTVRVRACLIPRHEGGGGNPVARAQNLSGQGRNSNRAIIVLSEICDLGRTLGFCYSITPVPVYPERCPLWLSDKSRKARADTTLRPNVGTSWTKTIAPWSMSFCGGVSWKRS